MDAAKSFRKTVAKRFEGSGPKSYPVDLRRLAVEYALEAKGRGIDLKSAARNLGIDPNTLRVWQKRDGLQETKSLRRIVVGNGVPKRAGFVVSTTTGLRCECATAQDAAALMRAFGC